MQVNMSQVYRWKIVNENDTHTQKKALPKSI